MKQIAFLTTFMLALVLAASAPFAESADLADYGELKRQVRETFALGRERTADAVERERVRTNWEVGKLIDEHVLLHKERADYGQRVIQRLAGDLETSQTELSYMLQFARAYPIYPQANKLSWSHYRELLALNEKAEREKLAQRLANRV